MAQQQGATLNAQGQKVATGATAVQAHQQIVARKEQANQQQKQKQGEAKSQLEQYANRKAGLESLKAPLGVWKDATGAVMGAEWLPVDVRGKLGKMNADAVKFEGQLKKLDEQMNTQIAAQVPAAGKLQADQGAIQAVGQQTVKAGSDMTQAQQSLDTTVQANQQKETAAGAAKAQAQQRAAHLTTQAGEKKQQRDNLAAQLQSWAEAHKAARQKALADAQRRLNGSGYTVKEVREK